MLKKVLSPSTCAACGFCCVFDREDSWELPFITDELAGSSAICGKVNLLKKGKGFVFAPEYGENGLFRCPMLTETGCSLGDDKPFCCRIWPFRVMIRDGEILLTLCELCPESAGLEKAFRSGKLGEDFVETVRDTAAKYPEIIHPFTEGYKIMRRLQICQ